MSLYLEGNWGEAIRILESTKNMIPGHKDGPSTTLLEYMKENNFVPPSDWNGYRVLIEK
jgi:hypothetical protein